MNARAQDMAAFLAETEWRGAVFERVAGDLSSRSYHRLTRSGGYSAILMDAPDRDGSTANFLMMAKWLIEQGLSAPRVLAASIEAGFLLLEDFGDAKLSDLIQSDPNLQSSAYRLCVDALLAIQKAPAPELSCPTAKSLVDATRLVDDWYPDADRDALEEFRPVLEERLYEILQQEEPALSLRDFHADNIIWLSARDGFRKLGLLDFQDAFLTHPSYDLMSLLTDARVDVPSSIQRETIAYFANQTRQNEGAVTAQVAILGAQRNLRILGIFHRAALRDDKFHHTPKIPRVYKHLQKCVLHPVFEGKGAKLMQALPAPESATA